MCVLQTHAPGAQLAVYLFACLWYKRLSQGDKALDEVHAI